MSYCDTCGHQYSDVCGTCETLDGVPVKYKKKTNADRIRAMPDEELAEWICKLEPFKCHKGYKFVNGCLEDETDCNVCILKWLKQEAT